MTTTGSHRRWRDPGWLAASGRAVWRNLGRVGNPPGITAKLVAVERIVEHVRRIEAGIAENALRVDRQPAARSQHDVVVMQVAMQRQHLDRIGQQPFRGRSRFDVKALFASVAIDLRLVEQTGKPHPQRLKVWWGRVVGWREQSCHHFGRDCCSGIVALLGENL
jgi:hypothetical protein